MEQNEEKVVGIDENQIEELLNGLDKLPPIEMDLDQYDSEEFQRGIKEHSYLAGMITALFNSGVSESFILDYILNKQTIEHNIETAHINKEMNVEISKNQKIAADKHEL